MCLGQVGHRDTGRIPGGPKGIDSSWGLVGLNLLHINK